MSRIRSYGSHLSREHHYQTCSNGYRLHHPYEDNINLVHAIRDVVDLSIYYVTYLNETLRNFYRSTLCAYNLHYRSTTLLKFMFILKRETYYVDMDEDLFQINFTNQPCLASTLVENQNRQVIPCGNYKWFVDKLIAKAREYLNICQSKSERKMHSKNLKFFLALLYLRNNTPAPIIDQILIKLQDGPK